MSTRPISEAERDELIAVAETLLLSGAKPRGLDGTVAALGQVKSRSGVPLSRGAIHGRFASIKRIWGISPDFSLHQHPEPVYGTETVPEQKQEPVLEGKVESHPILKVAQQEGVRRFILTCAQNNTKIHEAVWANLLVAAEYYDAEIMVSRFTYNKAAYGSGSVKPGTKQASDAENLWYDPAIEPYQCDNRVELAPGLVFCGEQNILPTAIRPLSGFESYTGRASGIFPHVKFAMESVASGKFSATKYNWTTGTVTQRNYIQKKAGLKADFHHAYGALLVEVDGDGDWFVRQLNARDSDGSICDLTIKIEGGQVFENMTIESINWFDIHRDVMDEDIYEISWKPGGILDTLKPRFQFFHDLLMFRSRGHHDVKNPHKMFERFVEGGDVVEDEIQSCADFLVSAHRDWCLSIIVDSNHDNHVTQWLRETDYRNDPVNAIFFLEAQLEKYRSIMKGAGKQFHLIEWAMRKYGCPPEDRFLREDESFIICPDASGGIECGMHGHLGTNGSRGNPKQFARMGRKANTGHTHSAGITDGVYTAGASSLDMDYNVGPSSWSHSFVVTYCNGKRSVITIWDKKWRVGK